MSDTPTGHAFEVTIAVPETMIRDVCQKAVSAAFFKGDGWRGQEGAGYQHVAREVERAIKAIDFGSIITSVLDEVLRPTVAEIVTEAIRAEAKKQVKQMKASTP